MAKPKEQEDKAAKAAEVKAAAREAESFLPKHAVWVASIQIASPSIKMTRGELADAVVKAANKQKLSRVFVGGIIVNKPFDRGELIDACNNLIRS